MADTINWHPDYWGAIIPLGSSGLPLDPLAWQVFVNFAKSLGLTEIGDITYFGVVQAWRPGVRPPATVPPFEGPIENPVPPPLWWSLLSVGDVVRTVRDGVIVRHAPTDAGAKWKEIGLTWGDMHIAPDTAGKPGIVPIADTDNAWLQVNENPMPLWVKASDVRRPG